MKVAKWLIAIVLMLSVFASVPISSSAAKTDPVQTEKNLNAAVKKGSWSNSAIYSKQLAVYYDENKKYDLAVKYYDLSAVYWTKAGHPSWGIANSIRADHIRTDIELYVETKINPNKTLEKNEPLSGTYLGLFLAGILENTNPAKVKDAYGRNHAIYLTYTKYGVKYKETDTYFPVNFAAKAKAQGSAIQVALEPFVGVENVKNDEVLRQFAKEAAATGVPVFLRYAGEMNGEWVSWHTEPEKYIASFRLVHDVMEELAPNVSMVWSPNFLPRDNIDKYYPGDKYVDWVGLSLYTIPFSHGEVKLGGNPIDYLKPIYDTYSHKPMMISEGAVSHYSFEQKIDYTSWANGQLGNMYGFLPRMMPQVKAITYFNLDKSTTSYDNSNNNYDISKSTPFYNTYKRLIQNDYFIDSYQLGDDRKQLTTQYKPFKQISELDGVTDVFPYIKLPLGVQPYYVAIYQDNVKLAESYQQPWDMKIDFAKVNPQKPLKIIAFDKNFKRLATKEVTSSYKKVSKVGTFTDVKSTFWAFNEIEKAYTNKLVNGYTDGSFKPNSYVSAAEFLTMIARQYNKQDEINKDTYPKGTLNYFTSLNYPHTLEATKKLTRTEVAEIIASINGFNYTGENAIRYVLTNELAKGYEETVTIEGYKGENRLTRAQAVKFIENMVAVNGTKELNTRPVDVSETEQLMQDFTTKFGQ